ncbi:hypothetical protein P2G72_08945 [Cronobacter sakazakii]|uniref:hypothetical protein n=1 Tax=Cronobacter sakazakii TaxID=28141 RepID=UPI002DBB6981|nr:hypothetical protein [Cronobacter sakazakii]MEB8629921.1 hypothetical protein [Cronobacter sakazakii]
MSEISKVIASEIADFFAGFGGPGEPDIQSDEAQRLLTDRVLSVLALRERAEPVAWISESNLKALARGHRSVYVKNEPILTRPVALYTAPPAPVVADAAAAIRACMDEFPESVHDIVEECADIAENAFRDAMA